MEIAWSHYYGIAHKLSLLTGMWPHLKLRTRFFRIAVWTLIMLTTFIPQAAHQIMCRSDWQCSFLSMTAYLLSIVIVLKVYTFQLNITQVRLVKFVFQMGARTIKDLTEHLYVDWKKLESPEEYEIMKSYAENCRRFCIIYPIYCFIAVWIFMSVAIVPYILDIVLPLNESRPILMPYPGYYFIDNEEYFIYIYWHSIIAWEIMIAGLVAHDCMFVIYVEHICSMFAIIGFRFEYLFYNHNDIITNVNIESNDIVYRKKITSFVNVHRETLKSAKLLESVFNMPFGIQLLLSTIEISITLLQITQETNLLKIIKFVLYVIGQLMHLFFLSFEGQKLIDHSVATCDRIYNSSWYEAPIKSRKLLMVVTMKSLRPAILSAGKIYIFSLESFTKILQTSMSYFTVLASFQ